MTDTRAEEGTESKAKRFVEKLEGFKDKNLPVTNQNGDLVHQIKDLKNQVKHLVERQGKEVGPEFKALMEGYVSKANESESLKVKYEHIQNYQEELKEEIKDLRDDNRRMGSDLDASREALKVSESELHETNNKLEKLQREFNDTTEALRDEKARLKAKLDDSVEERLATEKELEGKISKLVESQNKSRDEALEDHSKFKKVEQELQVQNEKLTRELRDAENLAKELREQVELRTREIEYKDALLSQLVRETAKDEQKQFNNQAQAKNEMLNEAIGVNVGGGEEEVFESPNRDPEEDFEESYNADLGALARQLKDNQEPRPKNFWENLLR